MIDALLESWRGADLRPVTETKVIAGRWASRSSEMREFLARNRLPHRWFLADEPEGARLLAAAGRDDRTLPVVVCADGSLLVDPTDTELAEYFGLGTTPAEDFYDLVVVGGGPAGLGAAVHGASEGLRTVLVERTATGGQARREVMTTGPELAAPHHHPREQTVPGPAERVPADWRDHVH